MSKMNIKTGDTVVILTGDKDNRGKTGKVMQISPKEGKVIVEGLNMVKKHVKARKPGDPSGIIEAESAIYTSKVQVVCPKCKKPTRIGHKIYEDGRKDRVCKKCHETF
jgi:ribosomal protein L24